MCVQPTSQKKKNYQTPSNSKKKPPFLNAPKFPNRREKRGTQSRSFKWILVVWEYVSLHLIAEIHRRVFFSVEKKTSPNLLDEVSVNFSSPSIQPSNFGSFEFSTLSLKAKRKILVWDLHFVCRGLQLHGFSP